MIARFILIIIAFASALIHSRAMDNALAPESAALPSTGQVLLLPEVTESVANLSENENILWFILRELELIWGNSVIFFEENRT